MLVHSTEYGYVLQCSNAGRTGADGGTTNPHCPNFPTPCRVPWAGLLCDAQQLLVHRLLAVQRGGQQLRDGAPHQQLKRLLGNQQVA